MKLTGEKNKNKVLFSKIKWVSLVVQLGHNLSGLFIVIFVYGHYKSEHKTTTNQQRGLHKTLAIVDIELHYPILLAF